MKKINYFFTLICVAVVFSSCAIGSYVPSTLNVGGVSTQVVLSQANYRIVRNIETVVDINNTNLRRADVEKSAFAELTRKYPLTGSQAYINVVLEEVRRESHTSLKQHVAIRATIIEFLQENGEPVKSVESPYNTVSQRTVPAETKNVEKQTQIVEEEQKPTDADEAYIMYLLKIGKFDHQKASEAKKFFDIDALQKQKSQYTVRDLESRSRGHNENLEKFYKR